MEQAKPALGQECQTDPTVPGVDRRREGRRSQESVSQLVAALFSRLSEQHESGPEQIPGIRTGFSELDQLTAGMHRGDLIVVAARPAMGKSSFALTIARHVALEEGLPVLLFSLEMDRQRLIERLASSSCGIHHQHLRTGTLRDADWGRLADALERLEHVTLLVDDTPALTLEELSSLARERSAQVGQLGLIVVDYLQLMAGFSMAVETRPAEIASISRGLKSIARELECPLVAISQLNRAQESRRDKRPVLADLRDSGAIEDDADVVLFIHSEDYANDTSRLRGRSEIIVGKQRNGPIGRFLLSFDKERMRFVNL